MPNANATIYEFGCGVGNNLRFLQSLFPDINILGSDISSVAIQKLKSANLENSEFWVSGDDLELNSRGPIDIVIERGAIQHTTKTLAKSYLRQISDAMRDGGCGYFELASTSHDKFEVLGEGGYDEGYGFRTFYTINDIEWLFEDFKIIRIHHLIRELVFDVASGKKQIQGSFQVEIEKPYVS